MYMAYRSERFDVGPLEGLAQVYRTIDGADEAGLMISDEIMAGSSYRRQLHPSMKDMGIQADYLLQVTLLSPQQAEGTRYSARNYIEESRKILGELSLPGEVKIDEGGIDGFDETMPGHAFGSTGYTERDTTWLYSPWLRTEWEEHGKTLQFYCGVLPIARKPLLELRMSQWDSRLMRRGIVVFSQTPQYLHAY